MRDLEWNRLPGIALPAKLAQSLVADGSPAGRLVDDGPANVVGDFLLGAAVRADRSQ